MQYPIMSMSNLGPCVGIVHCWWSLVVAVVTAVPGKQAVATLFFFKVPHRQEILGKEAQARTSLSGHKGGPTLWITGCISPRNLRRSREVEHREDLASAVEVCATLL
jgi:hypothetical protein